MNKHFSEEDTQIANKHMKKCSTALIIRETQIKTIMRYHLKPTKTATIKIKIKTENKYWQGCGELATLVHCWWEYKMVQSPGKIVW